MKDTGLYTYEQLRARGLSRHTIEKHVSSGSLVRISRNWYATNAADVNMAAAIKLRARLGCLSGCAFHGLWVPPFYTPHFAHGPGVSPKRSNFCEMHRSAVPTPQEPVWNLTECIHQVVHNHDVETALIIVESALHRDKISTSTILEILEGNGCKGNRVKHFLSEAESGTETRVRLVFQQRRVPVSPQVPIEGVGRVDLVVGKSLVVESDSAKFHSSYEKYINDRRRDLALRKLGYDVIRLSYVQVWEQWDTTKEGLLGTVRRRKHLRPPQPL